MSTAKKHDLDMSKEMILNTKYLKEGDYLLEDRGFLDILTFRKLVEKNKYDYPFEEKYGNIQGC